MKSVHGLLLAGALGFAGVLLNFAYLHMKTRDIKRVEFVGVAATDAEGRPIVIAPGERLTEDVLVRVGIPDRWVGELDDFAIRWEALETVEGEAVSRTVEGGRLVLEEDFKKPALEQPELGEDEIKIFVPVGGGFTPSLVNPGDWVSFLVAAPAVRLPTPAVPPGLPEDGGNGPSAEPAGAEDLEPLPAARRLPAVSDGELDMIGPFRVLAVGSRLGSAGVERAAGIRQADENVLQVAGEAPGGRPGPKAQKLLSLLLATNYPNVRAVVHAPKKPR
jgi:hypothetical protein